QTSAVSFFGSLVQGYRLFDPWVVYDKFSNRFMILFTSTIGNPKTGSRYYLAISKTSNPNSGWWLYWNNATLNGSGSTTNWADYPRLATDENAIYITANMFGFTTGFQYSKIRIMQNKSTLLSGGSSQLWWDFWDITISGSSTTKAFTIQPCHDYDDKSLSSFAYFVSCINGTGSNLYFYAINNVTRRTPPYPGMAKTSVAVASYASPGNSRQRGGTQNVENVAPRLMNAVKRSGSIWTAHSVKLGGTTAGAGVQWYECPVNSWPTSGSMSRRQQQLYWGGADYYYTFPSVAVNHRNDMSMVFCRSHTTLEYLGCRFTGRLATAPLSTLDGSVSLKAGEAYYVRLGSGRNRWGDYLGNCVDPQGNFWFIGEYARPSNQWATWIGTHQRTPSALYVPDAATTSTNCNVIPFGNTTASTTWANQRYMQLITAADLGNVCVADITDLGFVACGSGTRHFDSIQVILSQTNRTTLSTTFNTNRGSNVRTVLSQSNYEWVETTNSWNQVGLESTYRYDQRFGDNLVIEVIARGSRFAQSSGNAGHATGSRPRLYNFGWTSTPTTGTLGTSAALKVQLLINSYDFHQYGLSCPDSSNRRSVCSASGTGRIGTSYSLRLTNGPPNAAAPISIGLALWNPPLNLSIIGASSCYMYFDNVLVVGASTNSSGSHAITLPIPVETPPGVRVYFQYFPRDPRANAAGLLTSNYVKLLTGH
ncbi:MAG: hypothetical protein KDC87_02590, partial [Planctomycetes bacterium]|nr:hypothetical protein [Planctomycetota bacterium]